MRMTPGEGKDPQFGGNKDLKKSTDMVMPNFASGRPIQTADVNSIPQTAADLSNPFSMAILTALKTYINELADKSAVELSPEERTALHTISIRLKNLVEGQSSHGLAMEMEINLLAEKIWSILYPKKQPTPPITKKPTKLTVEPPVLRAENTGSPAPVETTKQQTRSRLLEFMRTHMGFLPESTIANLAAQISSAAREQLTQELRAAVKQRPSTVTQIGAILMPKQAENIKCVSENKDEVFVIMVGNQPTVWKVHFSNDKSPFTDFVLTKSDKEVFRGDTVEVLKKSVKYIRTNNPNNKYLITFE